MVIPCARAAEKYIIPVFGVQVRGVEGVYSSTLSLTNTSEAPVAARIADVMPMLTAPCDHCGPIAGDMLVFPGRTLVISDQGAPRIAAGNGDLALGALVIEADEPLVVESEVFVAPFPHAAITGWACVEIARDWIPGGRESILPRVIPPFQFFPTFNLFLINPNDSAARFEYWTDCGGRGVSVAAPHSTAMVALSINFLGNTCGADGNAPEPTGFALPLHVRADAPYLAAVSTRSPTLPPVVHVARAR